MGKKNKSKDDKDSGPPTTVPNRDIMQRMNFLYQASVCLQNAADRTPSGSKVAERGNEVMRRLARKHVKTLKSISNGAVVKIDPNIKRVLCKRCSTILVPGSTASVRIKTSGPHGKIVSYSCFSCQERRVIPAPPTKSLGNSTQENEASELLPRDTQAPGASTTQAQVGRAARRSKQARVLPFFARMDAGHVVYRGSERVDDAA